MPQITVRAKTLHFWGGARIKAGRVFVVDESEFNADTMDRVAADAVDEVPKPPAVAGQGTTKKNAALPKSADLTRPKKADAKKADKAPEPAGPTGNKEVI